MYIRQINPFTRNIQVRSRFVPCSVKSFMHTWNIHLIKDIIRNKNAILIMEITVIENGRHLILSHDTNLTQTAKPSGQSNNSERPQKLRIHNDCGPAMEYNRQICMAYARNSPTPRISCVAKTTHLPFLLIELLLK